MSAIKQIKELKEEKYTIIEYLKQVFVTFKTLPFNEIDALILSQLCYLNFDDIVPNIDENEDWVDILDLYNAKYFEQMIYKTLTPSLNLELISAICASPRYRNIKLNYFTNIYDKTSEEQFCAVTYKLTDTHKVVAFRGTDLSVTGWKEDFNMFFISPVPSQTSSVEYLNKVASKTTSNISLVGHSKGGNLAVYSNAFCKPNIHDRIIDVYNLDGPGFPVDILENADFIKESGKIIKIVPEGSVIGVMFETEHIPTIIKSYNIGLMQHDPFSWKCDDKKFATSPDFSNNIKNLDKTFNTWVYEMDINQRKTMVDTIFSIVGVLSIESLDEIGISMIKEFDEVKKALKDVDEETSKCIKEISKRFLHISMETQFGKINNKKINGMLNKLLK